MVAQFFRIQLPHLIEIENMGEMTKIENVTQVPSICDLLDFTPTQTLNADQNININTISVFTEDTQT